MKNTKSLITLSLGLVLAPVCQLTGQNTPEAGTVAGLENALPVAIRIVDPIISMDHVGDQVDMVFEVSVDGRTSGVHSRELFPEAQQLADAMMKVIPRWRFEPATDRYGRPKKVTVILPVRVAPSDKTPLLVAQLSLHEH